MMTNLIRSEIVKLASVRTSYLVAGGAVVAGGLGGLVLSSPVSEDQWVELAIHPFLALLMTIVATFAYAIGARAVTDEVANGTLAWTMLATPARHRVVAAKAVVYGTAGLVAGALAGAAASVLVMTSSAARSGAIDVGATDALAFAWWMGAVMGIWALIGVGVGAVVRAPVPAIVGGVGYILVGDAILGRVLREASRFLPAEAGAALLGAPVEGLLDRWEGALFFGGAAAVVLVAGAMRMRRAEIA